CALVEVETRGRRRELVARLLAGAPEAKKTASRSRTVNSEGTGKMAQGKREPAADATGAATYIHSEAVSPLRPDVGTQAQFKKRKPPVKYRYDSSLSPAMDWDGQNPAREQGEREIARVQAAAARLA